MNPSAFLARRILAAGLAIRKFSVPLACRGVRSIGRFLAGSLLVCLVVWWADPCLGGWPSPGAAGPVAQQCQNGQCLPGQCQQSRGIGVGLSVGGWRAVTPRALRPVVPVVSASSVVPVLFGTDPTPGAGVYVGVIGGRGVTLTCWHAAKHGVASVASERPAEITRDQYGYDMAAVFTRPLNVPVARLGHPPRSGVTVTITGFPAGRYGSHTGRVVGYFNPESGQPWGDLKINVASRIGDSGGGVFLQAGPLVGLLWGNRSDDSTGSVAVPLPAIAAFLERLRLKYEVSVIPSPPVTDSPPPSDDLAALRAELAELREQLTELRTAIAAIEPGRDGDDGDDGISPTIDNKAIAREVAKQLPPIYVRRLDVATNKEKVEEIHLGEGFTILNFPPE